MACGPLVRRQRRIRAREPEVRRSAGSLPTESYCQSGGIRSACPPRPYDCATVALTPGTRLGVYEVVALIGEGGMRQVYRAADTTLGRQVAIKILPGANGSRRWQRA